MMRVLLILSMLLSLGSCMDLDYSSNSSGIGNHSIELTNNSSEITVPVIGPVIIHCNNTGMWEYDRNKIS